MWHNIDRDAYDQFGKVDLTESSYYDQHYDYHSIMHYDSMAFSKNGFETLIAKQSPMTAVIGSAIDFSPVDLIKIKKMYSCPDDPVTAFNSLSGAVNTPSVAPVPAPPIPPPPPPPPITNINSVPLPPIELSQDRKSPIAEYELSSILACVDKTTLCWRWLDRCQSFFFEKIMREFCALSCGYCTPAVGNLAAPPAIAPPPLLAAPSLPLKASILPEEQPYYQRFGK